MLPRLMAEESLMATERIAVGTGSLDKHVTRRLLRAWGQQVNGHAGAPPPASPHVLGSMGIGYRTKARGR
jgi:hypothetical protein